MYCTCPTCGREFYLPVELDSSELSSRLETKAEDPPKLECWFCWRDAIILE